MSGLDLNKVFPETVHQHCWVHKTANVQNKLQKLVQSKVKQALHEIWMAPTKEDACKAFNVALKTYTDKYPKAMECLKKDKDEMLVFMIFQRLIGNIYERSIPLNQRLSRFVCGLPKREDV